MLGFESIGKLMAPFWHTVWKWIVDDRGCLNVDIGPL